MSDARFHAAVGVFWLVFAAGALILDKPDVWFLGGLILSRLAFIEGKLYLVGGA